MTDRPVADREHIGVHRAGYRSDCPACIANDERISARPVADQEPLSAEESHIPQPSDICSVCGRGLVHVIPSLDAALAQPAVPVAGAERHHGSWSRSRGFEPGDPVAGAESELQALAHEIAKEWTPHDHDPVKCPECAALRAAQPEDDGLDVDERFVRLATAVMQLRDFLALHRKATGRSDVNIRKVLALLDDALSDNPARLSESSEGVERREPQRVALNEIEIHDA